MLLGAGMIPAFCLMAAIMVLACVPLLFGLETSAGLASTERTLCGMTRDGATEILVGGDSRAKMQVDPAVLTAVTGKSSLNVAEPLPLGGDLATLSRVLRKYPLVMAGAPVLILSVSGSGLDDLALSSLTTAGMLNWNLRDHARVALRLPAEYATLMGERYFRTVAKLAWRKARSDPFVCDDNLHLPSYIRDPRGYLPDTDIIPDTVRPASAKPAGYIIDGAAWRMFRESLAWLAASPARKVILFNAPIYGPWQQDPRNAAEMGMEALISSRIAKEAARYPKLLYLDLIRNPPPGLAREHFSDGHHLNDRGAVILSRYLADYVMEEGPAAKAP